MERLETFIYYSICEKSYELYKKSHSFTFRGYCLILGTSLTLYQCLNSSMHRDTLLTLVDYLNKIYGLNDADSLEYIINFFKNERYLQFEESVRLIEEHFKNSLS